MTLIGTGSVPYMAFLNLYTDIPLSRTVLELYTIVYFKPDNDTHSIHFHQNVTYKLL
jgi:hypothetical protein